MSEVRVENEIKLISPGGPFAFDENDSSEAVTFIRDLIARTGMTGSEPRFIRMKDEYFSDRKDSFRDMGIILRYRVKDGWKHTVTLKQPYIRNGMGLSRRETETTLPEIPVSRFEAIEKLAGDYLEDPDVDPVPRLADDILRMRIDLRSDVRSYNLSFDRIVYYDPRSRKYTNPGYEMEIESLDQPIKDDRSIMRFVSLLIDSGNFREERISKYARGRKWTDTIQKPSETPQETISEKRWGFAPP